MKKSLVAIILLIGAFALNLGMMCQSLCAGGHKENHAMMTAEAGASHHADPMCTMHSAKAPDTSHECPGHKDPSTIKCGCCADLSAIDFDFSINLPHDLSPDELFVVTLTSVKPTFVNSEPMPLEGPPKLLA